MNYYSLTQFVSNSMLKEFKSVVYNIQQQENIQEIYDFGNLIDGISLEGAEVKESNDTFFLYNEASGQVMSFSRKAYELALAMKTALDEDEMFQLMKKGMKFQYVFTRNKFPITFEGMTIYLPVRCKFDGYEKALSMDLKTTGCTSRRSFVDSIYHFDYDQGAAWYMDIARIDKFILKAVCKKKDRYGRHLIFDIPVTRGDEIYMSGKKKYTYWSWKYYWMIHTLETNLLTINI